MIDNNAHMTKYQHYYYSGFQGFVVVAVILFGFGGGFVWFLLVVVVVFDLASANNAAVSLGMLPSLYVAVFISLGQIPFPNVELLGEKAMYIFLLINIIDIRLLPNV